MKNIRFSDKYNIIFSTVLTMIPIDNFWSINKYIPLHHIIDGHIKILHCIKESCIFKKYYNGSESSPSLKKSWPINIHYANQIIVYPQIKNTTPHQLQRDNILIDNQHFHKTLMRWRLRTECEEINPSSCAAPIKGY